MPRPRARRGRALVGMAAVVAVACGGGRRLPPVPTERAKGFSATVSVTTRDREGRAWRAHGFLAVAPPDRLRVELLDPVGRTRSVMVVMESRATVVMGDAYAETEGGAEMLEHLLGPSLPPSSLARVMLGEGPDEGELGPGVTYEREKGGDVAWAGSLRVEGEEGMVSVRLADHEPLGSSAPFGAPRTSGLRRVPVGELAGELRE